MKKQLLLCCTLFSFWFQHVKFCAKWPSEMINLPYCGALLNSHLFIKLFSLSFFPFPTTIKLCLFSCYTIPWYRKYDCQNNIKLYSQRCYLKKIFHKLYLIFYNIKIYIMTKIKINSYVALKCTPLYAFTLCAELKLYSGIFHVGLEPVFQRKYDLLRYK